MADRIIKGDSGNDVIIQNNGGTRKIEVTNSGDVEVTGDVKTTTVKATNLKANDGTAGLVVADSTGEVTSSGGFKAVNVKATNLKANDGTASLEIADSTGDIGFSGNTNLKLKLPSAGGIYESDGSTEILTESSNVVTLKNTVLNSTNTFPTGHLIKTTFVLRTGGTLTLTDNTITSACFTNYTCESSSNKLILMGLGAIVRGNMDGQGAMYYFLDALELSQYQHRGFKDNDEMPIHNCTLDGFSGTKEILLKIQSLSNNSYVHITNGNGFAILEIKQ